MNLEALTDIRLLADLVVFVLFVVLPLIWVSRYARRHGISLRYDSPAHKFMDDDHFNPSYRHVPGNAYYQYSEDD